MSLPRARWAGLALTAGGLLMAAVWLVYTNVHGPTSYDETNALWGRSTLFWGMLLGGPPPLLAALGLMLLRPRLVTGAGRLARIGHTLAVGGMTTAASIDLIIAAIGPPFFVPVIGAGLVLLAASQPPVTFGARNRWRAASTPPLTLILWAIGSLQLAAFALALIPNAVSDEWGGYRVYGLAAHFLTGLLWAALGVTVGRPQPAPVEDVRPPLKQGAAHD